MGEGGVGEVCALHHTNVSEFLRFWRAVSPFVCNKSLSNLNVLFPAESTVSLRVVHVKCWKKPWKNLFGIFVHMFWLREWARKKQAASCQLWTLYSELADGEMLSRPLLIAWVNVIFSSTSVVFKVPFPYGQFSPSLQLAIAYANRNISSQYKWCETNVR